MKDEMKKWENKKGLRFLEKIGVKSGKIVLDFGCGVGHYTVPAAKVTGKNGKVYGLDKDKNSLMKLRKKIMNHKLENIIVIETNGNLKIPLENNSIDIILFYDILHYLEKNEREKLYQEGYRILKSKGLFSVYPKHSKFDDGWGSIKNMVPDDIIEEIKYHNFSFKERYCTILSHDDNLNHGCVLNFRKKEQEES
jgi:ubiquinone/menaquinone biosynthesis C-methylase UbiE